MALSSAPSVPLSPAHRNPRPLLRAALIVAAYLFAFIILDFISQQFEELRGVVAWYPPAGLTYTLLLVFGVRFAPAVTIALLISSLFIYRMPQPPYLLFLWAFIISLIYSGAAAFLRHRIRFDWQLRKLRDVTWLVVTTVLVSALLAVLSVSSSALSSDMPRSEVLRAIFLWWIGETVGVLTVTPFLLIYVMPWLKRFAEGQPVRLPARRSFPRPTLSVIGQAFSIAFMLYWVFGARVLDEFQPMYLIALPLIWIALHHGFKGVTAGIVALNFGVMLAMWFFRFDLARLGELQLLMIVNCIVGLLMGAVVTERKQAEQTLETSERRFRDIADHAEGWIWEHDAEGTYTYASPVVQRILGYTPQEILQKHFYDLFLPDDREALKAAALASFATKQPFRGFVNRNVHKNGSIVWLSTSGLPVLDDKGSLLGYRGVDTDITENRQAEETMRQRLAELEALHTVSGALRMAQTRDEAVPIVLDETLAALETDTGALWLYDADSDELRPAAGRGWFQSIDLAPTRPGESVVGTVFANGQTHVSAELARDPLVQSTGPQHDPRRAGVESACPSAPARSLSGCCSPPCRPGTPITTGQVNLLESLTEMAGAALHRMSLSEETLRQLGQLQAMHLVDQAISSSTDLSMTLNVLLEHVATQLQVDATDVLLLNPHTLTLEYAAGRGFRTRAAERASIRLGEGLAGRAALQRRTAQAVEPAQMQESPRLAALRAGEGFCRLSRRAAHRQGAGSRRAGSLLPLAAASPGRIGWISSRRSPGRRPSLSRTRSSSITCNAPTSIWRWPMTPPSKAGRTPSTCATRRPKATPSASPK